VHALAKLLGTSSRQVLSILADLGEAARSPQSGVRKDVALKVAESLGVAPDDTRQEPAAGTAPQPSAAGATTEPDADANRPAARNRPAAEPPTAAQPATAARSGRAGRSAPPAAAPASPGPVHTPVFAAPSPVFLPPDPVGTEPAARQEKPSRSQPEEAEQEQQPEETADSDSGDGESGAGRRRRRRGRRGRGRGKGADETDTGEQEETADHRDGEAEEAAAESETASAEDGESAEGDGSDGGNKRRRRRRRRKSGDDGGAEPATQDDPPNTVVHVRETKAESKNDGKNDGKNDKGNDKNNEARDGVRSVRGSTRLEAKRQRRRDGREAGRRRAPILSEAEFLTRRESVDRAMVVGERGDSTQIAVLEDGVLVEHFVTSSGNGSIVGNVYLGRVQNVLPSMEAAFIDIGRGRNAVLYAGEVDWDAAGLEGKARKIEQALTTGDNVLVQVTKDPIGHKGARLTTQISLPGRFLVYVPSGGATGISRKLPENERRRLKDILKRVVPDDAGVIIRTASEGISEEELARDVRRLKAQWEVIKEKADSATGGKKASGPVLLYEEPDLLVKVVRDLFTEDFSSLEIQGNTAWETIHAYVEHVAPELTDRLKRYLGTGDVFADHRIDEQLTKALDRKVWLPSGGYLVIDRTEAMTVIDVNTGKFTGSGGNLEETVTRNNLESAEEIVRQLRLRDIGGIIVIDFIDMVLESNRELVLRRLTECLGRDRTRHQVAEVTSLGLVQMTRKRVGTGLLEAFSTTCEHCKGRGVIVSSEPNRGNGNGGNQGSRRSRGKGKSDQQQDSRAAESAPTPEQRESAVSAVQAMANASKAVAGRTDDGEDSGSSEPSESSGLARPQPAAEPTGRVRNGRRAGDAARQAAEPAPQGEPEPSAAGERPAATPAETVTPPASSAGQDSTPAPRPARRRARRAASRPAGPPVHTPEGSSDAPQ
jgi:ribonuclease E